MVATPIGNARDITLRTLDILAAADVLAAEDTRSLRRLMEIHGVALGDRRVLPYHDHNGPKMRPVILKALMEGKSVAYASEAGTPLVSDPGYALVRDAAAGGHAVTAAPGASAALAALVVAGLPSDRFTFAGFAPSGATTRRAFYRGLAELTGSLIVYETPNRLADSLEAAAEGLGADRPAVICRELTKRFEEVRRDTLGALLDQVPDMTLKGEVVLVIGPAPDRETSEADIEAAMAEAMQSLRLKEAAAEVAERLGIPKREAYAMGLKLKGD
ncbi:16S rRNA (cytidine(1402)-2'-O)-methyltransferase [Alphaproteobacteria bacterium GH1-50]|uniref:16S rRNA (Cytidine(1402)-2'-O)-methyltransferase n=1 Tax=Kangsaoukella pontilimi TaxID=2691042 RepID=A0A7C9ME08_9RHOB|nr:16S rRNA (cytidine(1402)-2'-O)-methyltransferase [Kangsaoukella pontilimi]MXQ08631.1 16S rRNA (cytidine(1402)-2'-O)-methyltransferase [Kangsaoukella pontilimi]